jgi:hypothetical protein
VRRTATTWSRRRAVQGNTIHGEAFREPPEQRVAYWRTSNNAETEIMETAVETRIALEVRAT